LLLRFAVSERLPTPMFAAARADAAISAAATFSSRFLRFFADATPITA
jgi:hypothetical protein